MYVCMHAFLVRNVVQPPLCSHVLTYLGKLCASNTLACVSAPTCAYLVLHNDPMLPTRIRCYAGLQLAATCKL